MQDKFLEPNQITSIELLEKEVCKVLLLQDSGVVKMIVAAVIANRMPLDTVWLMLVSPPSGGKSELINAITGLDFVFPISDLTVNTFASGQKKIGKETSLLMKMQNGIMVFKDFTSVLSKNKDAKKEIMGQLREIFDGDYVKRTGTGDDITWKGKIGAIAGVTEVIYRHIEEMSAMGDRFILYNIDQPDRMEVAHKAMENAEHNIAEQRMHLKECFTFFIKLCIENMSKEEIVLGMETKEELLEVANFATIARSAVLTDFKSGLVDFVPSPEMPMRVSSQLFTLASAFVAINRANPTIGKGSAAFKGELTEKEKNLLFKVAFDSIPRTRRDVLFPLAKYKEGISTAGIATLKNMPTDSMKKYLAQINALGICTRIKKGGSQGDIWRIKESYRKIMMKLHKIDIVDGQLLSDNIEEDFVEDEDIDKEFQDLTKETEQDTLDIKL